MKNAVILTAALSIFAASSLSLSASPVRDAPLPAGYGEQIERKAGQVLSPKELSERGLSASDTIIVTKAPQGPVDTSKGS